jgi:hypothetical protein
MRCGFPSGWGDESNVCVARALRRTFGAEDFLSNGLFLGLTTQAMIESGLWPAQMDGFRARRGGNEGCRMWAPHRPLRGSPKAAKGCRTPNSAGWFCAFLGSIGDGWPGIF